MYFVPDGTQLCGFYECKSCAMRYLDVRVMPRMVCNYCGEEADMEIGPDDDMPEVAEDAVLLEVVRGEEEIVKMDTLLSLAITGGDYDWL